MKQQIRLATPADSQGILDIYGKYIEETAVSFETQVPSLEDMAQRIETISQQYPYLVYESAGNVVGYAYASLHGQRQAYCYDVNLSIYVHQDFQHLGQGKVLYQTLFALLKAQGYYNAYAAYSQPNEKSRRFHEKLGFQTVGTFPNAGYKLGKWHDLTWVSLPLQDYVENPGAITPMNQLPPSLIQSILAQHLTIPCS